MSSLEIRCSRCESNLTHTCNPALKRAVFDLLMFQLDCRPEWLDREVKAGPMYSEGDETYPLFTDPILFNLFSKDDARSIKAMLHNVLRQAGHDPHAIRDEFDKLRYAKRTVEEAGRKLAGLRRKLREAKKAGDEEALAALKEEMGPHLAEEEEWYPVVNEYERGHWKDPKGAFQTQLFNLFTEMVQEMDIGAMVKAGETPESVIEKIKGAFEDGQG